MHFYFLLQKEKTETCSTYSFPLAYWQLHFHSYSSQKPWNHLLNTYIQIVTLPSKYMQNLKTFHPSTATAWSKPPSGLLEWPSK